MSSSLSAERSLDDTDSIEGGEGTRDRLELTMKSTFLGFTKDKGGMKGVETLVLTNDSIIDRSFSAKETSGISNIILNSGKGTVSLADLPEAGISVRVNDQKSGNLSIGFATSAVTGTGDALTVTLGGGIGATSHVSLATTQIEALSVSSLGLAENKLAIGALGTNLKTLSVSGSAALNLRTGTDATQLESIDASSMTAALTLAGTSSAAVTLPVKSFVGSAGANTASFNISNGTLSNLAGGAAADKFTVSTTSLAFDAVISGGEGADSLTFAGGVGRGFQPRMSGVETLVVSSGTSTTNLLSGTLSIEGTNVTDLATVEVGTTGADVSLTQMKVSDLAIKLNSATTMTAGQTISSDHAGKSTVSLSTTATTAVDNFHKVSLSKSNDVTVDVGTNVTFKGDITTAAAKSLTLNSQTASTTIGSGYGSGTTDGTSEVKVTADLAELISIDSKAQLNLEINAAKATTASVKHSGTSAGRLELITPELEQLSVTSSKAFTLATTGTNLGKLQIVNISSAEGALVVPALPLAKQVTLTGSGTATDKNSTLTVGDLTSTDSLSVTLSGFKGGTTGTNLAGSPDLTAASALELNLSGIASQNTVFNVGDIKSSAGGVTVLANGGTSPKLGFLGVIQAKAGTATLNLTSLAADSTLPSSVSARNINFSGSDQIKNVLPIDDGGGGSTVTAFNVTVNGGNLADTFTIAPTNTALATITVSGALKSAPSGQFDSVVVTPPASTAASGLKIDVSGVSGLTTSSFVVIGAANGTINAATKGLEVIGSPTRDFINIPTSGGATITGGAGSDIFHFPNASFDIQSYDATTGVVKLSTTNPVVIKDFKTGGGQDLISFAGYTGGAIAGNTTAMTTKPAEDTTLDSGTHFVRGNYNSSTSEFTFSTTGTSTLFVTTLASGNTNTYAVVLEGYLQTATSTTTTVGTVTTVGIAAVSADGAAAAYTGLLGAA